MRIGSAIMAASSLSFLGFGANVTDPEWGAMLSQSRSYLNVAPHMVYFPGLVDVYKRQATGWVPT